MFPNGQALDAVGPADVFSAATALGARDPYDLRYVSHDGGPLRLGNGIRLHTERGAGRSKYHTVIITGGLVQGLTSRSTVKFVRSLDRRSERIGSVCTGAFALAAAGVLDGHTCTTHWASCKTLAKNYPAIKVREQEIVVRSDEVWSSAGVTAGIDLALAMVADDEGAALARAVARWLVVYLKRPSGQRAFATKPDIQTEIPKRSVRDNVRSLGPKSADQLVTDTLFWIEENLERSFSLEDLATKTNMSVRHYIRVFTRNQGMTPGKYIASRRTARSQELLETTELPLREVAKKCGYSSYEGFHAAFTTAFGVSPLRHRRMFRDVE